MNLAIRMQQGSTHPYSVVEPYTVPPFKYEKEHAVNLTYSELQAQFPNLSGRALEEKQPVHLPAEWINNGSVFVGRHEIRHCGGRVTDKYLCREGLEIPLYRVPTGKEVPEGFVPVALVNDFEVNEWGFDGALFAIKVIEL